MIVLDSNVLSALMRDEPDRPVTDSLDRQAWTTVWTTSVTILEIASGFRRLRLGSTDLS